MELVEIFKNRGLSDELINNISEYMDKNKIYTTSIKNADEECSKLETEINNLKGQLDTANTTIKDLKKNNKDNETLQNTIAEHEKTIEKLQQESIKKDFTYTLRKELEEAGCIDSEALEVFLDMEKLKLEEGKISGLEEQIAPLKETKNYLFEKTTPENTGSPGDYRRKKTPIVNPWAKETLNLTEQARILKENPALAEQLKSNI